MTTYILLPLITIVNFIKKKKSIFLISLEKYNIYNFNFKIVLCNIQRKRKGKYGN